MPAAEISLDLDELTDKVLSGVSRRKLAIQFGVSRSTIDKRIKALGLTRKPKVQISERGEQITYSHPRTTLASDPFGLAAR